MGFNDYSDHSDKCKLDGCLSGRRRDPWESPFAAIAPRISGSISAVSSLLIIYVILRSKPKLSNVYHRIMFGLSVADIMGSVSMALTSLPMPSHMSREEEFGYHWAGTRLGNTHTCNAQGFFATFGMVAMFGYNGSLCFYYACAIAIGMNEKKIKQNVEKPVLHAIPILLGLGFAVPPLFYDLYNPAVTNVAWCFPQPYPFECRNRESVKCVRGQKSGAVFLTSLSFLILFDFVFMMASLVAVFVRVKRSERLLDRLLSRMYGRQPNYQRMINNSHTSKVVLIQSSAYIAAFLTSLLPPLLRVITAMGADIHTERRYNTLVRFDKTILILLPLQGFFNFVIFISHKIYSRKKVDKELRICQALSDMFFTTSPEPCYFSRITLVQVRHATDNQVSDGIGSRQSDQILEFNVENEDGEQIVFWCNANDTGNNDGRDESVKRCGIIRTDGGPSRDMEFVEKESLRAPPIGTSHPNDSTTADPRKIGTAVSGHLVQDDEESALEPPGPFSYPPRSANGSTSVRKSGDSAFSDEESPQAPSDDVLSYPSSNSTDINGTRISLDEARRKKSPKRVNRYYTNTTS